MCFKTLTFCVLVLCVASSSEGGVIGVDYLVSGDQLLTRDEAQQLDFLDLTESLGLSFNFVSGQFGVGGMFDGFRYASESEVIDLANNFGFPALAGSKVNSDTIDLSGLVGLVGITQTSSSSLFSHGRTSTPGANTGFVRKITILDTPQVPTIVDYVDARFEVNQGSAIANMGSWLVRDTQAVPEPTSLAAFGIGVFVTSISARRRKKRQVAG